MFSYFRASPEKPYGYWLPLDISTHGSTIDLLINVLHVFIVVFFVGWLVYFVWVLVRFRRSKSVIARERSDGSNLFRFPLWIEIAVAVFEIFLLVYLAMPFWWRWQNSTPNEAKALHIRVVAQQFQWLIQYPGADGKFGKTSLTLVDEGNLLGIDKTDPAAKDDVVSINHFHVPVHQPVIVELSSKDVIHSFYIPVLRVKQDVIPGVSSRVWFEATREGQDFEIACAQLCGTNHSNMRGFLHVDSQTEYTRWLEANR